MKTTFICTVFLATGLLSPTRGISPQDSALLAKYEHNLTEHRHFTAQFTQKRHMSMFNKPLVSTGTIAFEYPDRIVFRYDTPFESVILFTEGTMKRYRKENDGYVEQPSLEIVAKAITKEILKYLSGSIFTDSPYTITIDTVNPRHITLVPQRSAAKALFESIELFLPETKEYVERIRLNEPSGDYIEIIHRAPSFAPVDQTLFKVQ